MKTCLVLLALIGICTPCLGQVLFLDDFENGLAFWPLRGYGIITTDPVGVGNSVLSFSHTQAAGDIFSIEIPVIAGRRYLLHFDYIGVVGSQTEPNNLGGYIGYSDGQMSQLKWLGGTELCDSAEIDIVDDSQWHSYAIDFSPHDEFSSPFNTIRIMVEDWNGAAAQCPPDNLAGDIFFDNIVVAEYDPVVIESESWGAVKALYR